MSIMLHQVSSHKLFRIQSLFIVYVTLSLALCGPVTKKFEKLNNLFPYCAHFKALLLFIYLEIDCLHGLKVREYLHSSVFQLRAKSELE